MLSGFTSLDPVLIITSTTCTYCTELRGILYHGRRYLAGNYIATENAVCPSNSKYSEHENRQIDRQVVDCP